MKRLLRALVAALPLSLVAVPAGAAPPLGSCPPAFNGPLTFAQVVEMWPPPPGVDPTAALAFYDKNADGTVCVRPFPDGVRINVIDNAANLP
jgi:hypothetical protein